MDAVQGETVPLTMALSMGQRWIETKARWLSQLEMNIKVKNAEAQAGK